MAPYLWSYGFTLPCLWSHWLMPPYLWSYWLTLPCLWSYWLTLPCLWNYWLMPAFGQLGRQRADVGLFRVERSRLGERRLGIVEPTLGQRRPGRGDTPIHHALPDSLFERGMAFRRYCREIALARIHNGPELQERFRENGTADSCGRA